MNTIVPMRILSVDDHPMLREGIAAVVAGEDDMLLVAEGQQRAAKRSNSFALIGLT